MESIGQRLKKKRQEKKLTLEQVHKATKIHHKVLAALEQDRAQEFLSPVYIKSFLKLYSKFLGLDSESIVKEYTQIAGIPQEPQFQLSASRNGVPFRKNWLANSVFFIFLIAASLVVYLSLRGIFKRHLPKLSGPALPSESAPRTVLPAQRRSPKVDTASRPKQSVRVDELNLVLKANADTWIQLKCDGKIVFQNVLTKGNIESWRAKDKIEMWVGNAGGLELELNGKKLSPLGRSGQVIKDIVITRDEVRIGK
jgi:cytoskeletal protein RodZ